MSTPPLDPEALRKLPLFSTLSDTQLAWLAPAAMRRRYAARACILRAGDTPDGLFVILSGHARMMHEDARGHAFIAEDFGANDFFGEMALIDPTPCPASVSAIEQCDVVYLPRTVLLKCLEESVDVAVGMLRAVVARLCEAHHRMAELALITVHGRVARVLLENGRGAGGEWFVEPGSEQIAAMVGASREMVSRVVKSMIRKGLVRRFKRKLIVVDRARLTGESSSTDARRV